MEPQQKDYMPHYMYVEHPEYQISRIARERSVLFRGEGGRRSVLISLIYG